MLFQFSLQYSLLYGKDINRHKDASRHHNDTSLAQTDVLIRYANMLINGRYI